MNSMNISISSRFSFMKSIERNPNPSRVVLDAVLYYVFHFLYLGHPSEMLARFWLAHDIAVGRVRDDTEDAGKSSGSRDRERELKAWKMLDDSLRESYRAIGVLAGLIAAAVSALFAIDQYTARASIRVLLLVSLTSSFVSAASCISFLSTVYLDPIIMKHHWMTSGLVYILVLSGPSAWLSIALWTLQAALLAIVWLAEGRTARALVTTMIALLLVLKFWSRLASVQFRVQDFLCELLGRKQGMNHRMVHVNKNTIASRNQYLQSLEKILDIDSSITRRDAEFNEKTGGDDDSGTSATSYRMRPPRPPPRPFDPGYGSVVIMSESMPPPRRPPVSLAQPLRPPSFDPGYESVDIMPKSMPPPRRIPPPPLRPPSFDPGYEFVDIMPKSMPPPRESWYRPSTSVSPPTAPNIGPVAEPAVKDFLERMPSARRAPSPSIEDSQESMSEPPATPGGHGILPVKNPSAPAKKTPQSDRANKTASDTQNSKHRGDAPERTNQDNNARCKPSTHSSGSSTQRHNGFPVPPTATSNDRPVVDPVVMGFLERMPHAMVLAPMSSTEDLDLKRVVGRRHSIDSD
ncbi:hypothetical protein D9758_007916 [Tetrapyrgos nigripes]|uniref:Uncharacterized protein n=1 Tax=Tetrapyrgos nigripes TaxID=182062 RepID=A0A8H5FXU2_9AGAR|nr:hypothetical protein D9758_007916 [Tetrapyrgos nigripes]